MITARGLVIAFACLVVAVAAAMVWRARAPSRTPAQAWSGVEFAGCAAVVRGPTCALPANGHLRLWVPETATAPLVSTDRGPLVPTEAHEIEGGMAFEVSLPAEAKELRVAEAPPRARAWTLHVTPNVLRSWADELAQLRESGQLDELRARLLPILATAQGADRARAEGMLAREELARGDYESAVTHFKNAIAVDRAEGLISSEADDSTACSFALDERLHRYSDARAVLAALAEVLPAYPEGQARLPFYEGLLLQNTADLRSALVRFEESQRRAARLGMSRLEHNAASSYAQVLAGIGMRADGLARLHAIAESSAQDTPCDRAAIFDAIGVWTIASLVSADGDVPQGRARSILAPAEDAFTREAALYPRECADAFRHANALLGLAEVALHLGDAARARARLTEARSGVHARGDAFFVLSALDLDARIALAENDAHASLSAYDEEERKAGGPLPASLAYTNAVGRGETLEALGRTTDALAQYQRAERLLDERSLQIPLSDGRLSFLADRQRSARDRIDLLLRLGRDAEAMAAARLSRARAVAMFERDERIESLDPEQRTRWEKSLQAYRELRDRIDSAAESDWQLPSDDIAKERARRAKLEAQLREALDDAYAVVAKAPDAATLASIATRDGELVLVYHPIRRGQWAGFAAMGSTVHAFRFEPPTPNASAEDIASRLLEPVHAQIANAKRVHILASGALRAYDLHALPFDHAALLDHAVVTYGTDRTGARRAAPASRRALIVADPNDNLARTLDEAHAVANAMHGASSWEAISLVRDEATSVRLRELLPTVSWLHYAGHGAFDAKHGLGSALLLANGTRLTVGDVLALPSAPANVVLSGCETGRTDGEGAADGLGLAQAFVAAGAQVAVAPIRKVQDETAASLSALLYRGFSEGNFDLASSLQAAQRDMRASAPNSDWAAFRAVTP